MEEIKILIISDPSRVEDYDIENAVTAFRKYIVDDKKMVVKTIRTLDIIAREVFMKLPTVTSIYIRNMSYVDNDEIVNESDALILLPSLDRTGFCEDLEKKWLKYKGDTNLEML